MSGSGESGARLARNKLGLPVGTQDTQQGSAAASGSSAGAPDPAAFAARIRDVGEATPSGETSSAGARAQMQVLPSTAANPGFGISPARDQSFAEYNRVGQEYAAAMLARYGGNVALASAAYNAGPGRVDQWIRQYGDPRTGKVSDVAWAQSLPVAETRNYALRMMGVPAGTPTSGQAVAQQGAQVAQAFGSLGQQATQNSLGAPPLPAGQDNFGANPLLPESWGAPATPAAAPPPAGSQSITGADGMQYALVPVEGDPFSYRQGNMAR